MTICAKKKKIIYVILLRWGYGGPVGERAWRSRVVFVVIPFDIVGLIAGCITGTAD